MCGVVCALYLVFNVGVGCGSTIGRTRRLEASSSSGFATRYRRGIRMGCCIGTKAKKEILLVGKYWKTSCTTQRDIVSGSFVDCDVRCTISVGLVLFDVHVSTIPLLCS